jgi:hypothetical protein
MSRLSLAVLVAGTVVSGATPAPAQSPPTQLDRIERKLDTILRRLDQLQPGTAEPTASPPALSSPPEIMAAGAVAIIHAAPVTQPAAREIPADSVGGFIYTGGSIQLADLTDRGVRYTGLAGVEWQGWLRAREAGRYQFELDGSTVSPNNYTNSTCVFAGWLEDHSIGVQETTPHSGFARPEPFTLVLGAELSPSLYKTSALGCLHAVHRQSARVSGPPGKGPV